MLSFLHRHKKTGYALVAFLVLSASVCARAEKGVLFTSDEPLAIELRAPLETIYSERRREERDEHPGVVQYAAPGGQTVSLNVGVRTRGNFRRHHCNQAPLRLRFKKKQVAGSHFDGEGKLKLVSPCRKGARYEELIVAEYYVYRIYALLSDYHFRVRPLSVTFIDSAGKNATRTSFGFFIEDMDNMAARYERVVPDWERTEFHLLEPRQLALVDVFQFMVGGHDWSVVAAKPGQRCCHNSRLITVEGSRKDVIPVPYDFDLTGIVNAPYAFPPEGLPIDNVRQRYFRGRCKSDALWKETLDHYRAMRPAINALFEEPIMKKRLRKRSQKYLNQFYEILDDPKRLKRMVMDRCAEIVATS